MEFISLKDEHLASYAYLEAEKSPCLMRHGCIAVVNGKIIARGHNHYRTNSHDKIIDKMCSCHAEMDTLRSVLYSQKLHIKERKYQLKVV